jgi:SAM-dependent methyltransferase
MMATGLSAAQGFWMTKQPGETSPGPKVAPESRVAVHVKMCLAEVRMNSWDEKYGAPGHYYGTEPNDFLREHCAVIPAGGTVLCLAEGEGRNAVFLAQQGYRVVAVDQSPVGLRKAEALATERGVEIETVVADLADFRIAPDHWDGIVSIWCHLPQPLRAAVHGKVAAGLKVGGAFLLEAYTPAQLGYGTGGPKTADLLPTLADLRAELVGLDLVHAVEREREVHEGQGHFGLSAVVDIVAVKR